MRTQLVAAVGPMRSRARSQLAVEAAGWSWSAPAAPAGVQVGQLPQPLAVQPVHQPAQDQHPFGPDPIGQHAQVLCGQPIDSRGQGGQPLCGLYRMCVRIHGRQPDLLNRG